MTRCITILCALVFAGSAGLAGCDNDDGMINQPRHKPLDHSRIFDDGAVARPLVNGTVARGALDLPAEVRTGRRNDRFVDTVPVPVTADLLNRGREQFNIYCAPCHGLDAYGRGMVVQRGFTAPPSLHIDRLLAAPDGYYFEIITSGFGRMPSYAVQVPVTDRWAIIAYIRALQLSQRAPADALTDADRAQLEEAGP